MDQVSVYGVFDHPLVRSVDHLRNILSVMTGTGYDAELEPTEAGWEMKVALPGVGKANIDVREEAGRLRVWTWPKGRGQGKEHLAVVCMRLPTDADRTGITSKYVDGMLTVHIPKSKSHDTREIEITG